ncbi:MAG: M50 family metallopeptidase [Bacteroidota bacterium]
MSSIDWFSLIIFVVSLGLMIFLHELGHFLASRFFGIEVEEFGFGLPPRILGFWRAAGYMLINGRRVEIPRNFDRGLDWQRIVRKPVTLTAESVNGALVLRSLEVGELTEAYAPSTSLRAGSAPGPVKVEGVVTEVHPGTLLSLNWLPIGGFVRPKGENDPRVAGGLAAASPWKRIAVLFAGPVMNLLTAVILFGIVTGMQGIEVPGPVHLEQVSPASPAQQAGLQVNDRVLAVNGQSVQSAETLISTIQANLDKPIDLLIERDGKQIHITVTPDSHRSKEQGAVGIVMAPATRPATVLEIARNGVVMMGLQAAGLVYLPVALLQGVIQPDQARLVGLKGIFDMVNQAVQRDVSTREGVASAGGSPAQPTNWTLYIMAMLSVSLGVINLFPIPALDGGRILFTLPEILFHRRVPMEFENMVNGVAMLLLIAFMLFINVMDFIKPAPPFLP